MRKVVYKVFFLKLLSFFIIKQPTFVNSYLLNFLRLNNEQKYKDNFTSVDLLFLNIFLSSNIVVK